MHFYFQMFLLNFQTWKLIQKSYCSTYNNYNGKNKCTNAGFSNCMGLSKESKCGCDQVTKHNFTPKVVKRLLQENKHKKVRIFIYSPKSILSNSYKWHNASSCDTCDTNNTFNYDGFDSVKYKNCFYYDQKSFRRVTLAFKAFK